MYQRLCRRLPPTVVDVAYVLWRAGLLVLVVVYSDLTLGAFQYVNF